MKKRKSRIGWLAVVILALGGGNAHALDMGVFGDMSLSDSNSPSDEPSFRLGSLDLYAAQYIDENTRGLFEVQFQTFFGEDIQIEIQRFWIMREFSQHFNIGLGRFHTPLGYWNRNFHHGILLQDTVSRPFILSFEGSPSSIIPMHLIGALAQGEIGGGFHYEAAIANSNTIDSSSQFGRLEVPNRTDLSADKSLFGRLSFDNFGKRFKPGIFAMKNNVLESGSNANIPLGDPLIKQHLVGADFRYELGSFDIMAEYFWIENEEQPGVDDEQTHESNAWFAQFGYQLTDNLKATYRHESLDFDNEPGNVDWYYMGPNLLGRTDVGTEERNVYALRYDFTESNALLLEVNDHETQLGDDVTNVYLSWAFVLY